MGIAPRCASIRPARVEVLTGSPRARAGARDDLRAAGLERLGIPIENISIVHGDTDKVQFGMGTYGSRSGAVGMSAIVKALDKVEAKAKKVAAPSCWKRPKATSCSRTASSQLPAPTSRLAWGDVVAQRLYRAQIRRRRA